MPTCLPGGAKRLAAHTPARGRDPIQGQRRAVTPDNRTLFVKFPCLPGTAEAVGRCRGGPPRAAAAAARAPLSAVQRVSDECGFAALTPRVASAPVYGFTPAARTCRAVAAGRAAGTESGAEARLQAGCVCCELSSASAFGQGRARAERRSDKPRCA